MTEAGGFIGMALIERLVAEGCQVSGLAGSVEAARRVRAAGATPVIGDLLTPGQWQDEAAADWVFQLPRHAFNGSRVTPKQAESIGRAHVSMDAHLLDVIEAGPTTRIVYVADASCYGATGSRAITEDAPRRPGAWGQCFEPALARVEGYSVAGLPIVTAFPGWVYGNGSWFAARVIEPIVAGRPVLRFGKTGPWVSSIHVHDCARALVYLAQHGEAGGSYFLVDSEPTRLHAFAETFARLAKRRLRSWPIPTAASRIVAGPVCADLVQADAVFSNIRLRGIGFQFDYPTIEQGIQQIIGAFHD
ncbi:MAG: NAD-dependent epimerase/dehydratase family protein [Acidobacteriota bacterium]